MKKKKKFSDFYDFPVARNNEKKNSFIMKNEISFLSRKILMGHCPFCIVRRGLGKAGLYCNTVPSYAII